MPNFLTYRETIQCARDYLEVAFHTLLYIRQVYPAELFRQVKKYGVPCWQCRNPALSEYLARVLECVQEEMVKGAVRRVILVIKEASLQETPLERFVFEFEWLVPQRDVPAPGDDFTPSDEGLETGDVEDLFRACLLKLNLSSSHLSRLKTDVSFAVVLEMRDGSAAPESKAAREGHVPAEWIPAEQRQAVEDDGTGPGRGRPSDKFSTISTLESVRLGLINMDIRVEETAEKFEEGENSSGEVAPAVQSDRKGKGRAY